MLTSLTLQNFALIEHHELNFCSGFNVITGETGAGKSLLLDALALCVGGRTDSSMVRHGQANAEIYAQFEVSSPAIQTWFQENEREFVADDGVLIRRQISAQGRSKAWLNGVPISLSELKELGRCLVHIHSQHAQQALLKPQFVVEWLDKMAGLTHQAEKMAEQYRQYQSLQREATQRKQAESQRQDRIRLLENQLAEIAPLLETDYAQIEAEHEEMANLESLMQEASQALYLLENEAGDGDAFDVMGLLGRAIKICDSQSSVSQTFAQASEQLYLAQQQISEATVALADYAEQQLPNPERLDMLNGLISLGHRLSRQHGLPVSVLVEEAEQWQEELDSLHSQPSSDVLAEQVQSAWQEYLSTAEALNTARMAVASKISQQLVAGLQPLALPNAQCEFEFHKKEQAQFNAQGMYDIELMFSANVGMPAQPLYKVASGGELSRMALVMQVLVATDASNASSEHVPTVVSEPMLVFDEVDVGISGGTAQVVGELLRQLGGQRQLLAITHQAQVASQAHQHILVQKHHDTQTSSQLTILTGDAQVDELARMSGGVHITEVTREHARSLLADVYQHSSHH
ncbi:DNA repair protein RecN [Psychrobacter sp. I-STPA6b]|uniref:DNA repair protein RecN n=1 Tax=Psychrobacter sp. I-STPA6b TaxID=2585718 RepID=UPI001D0C4201|nr:DNA repair protein RecN [Psychrobacter sp. I-STPA6b]